MKTPNFIKAFAALISIAWLLYACWDNDGFLGQKAVQSDHFISKALATKIAGKLIFKKDDKALKSQQSNALKKQIRKVCPVPDESAHTVFYIINYEGGGFVILSADNRVMPVLAYSDENAFPHRR